MDFIGLEYLKGGYKMIKKSRIQNSNYKTCGDHSVEAGRGTSGQIGWYVLASKFCKNQSVVDVGCGLGKGLEILCKVSKKHME